MSKHSTKPWVAKAITMINRHGSGRPVFIMPLNHAELPWVHVSRLAREGLEPWVAMIHRGLEAHRDC